MIRAALLLACLATPAAAHEWYTGQKNQAGESCCGGNDCDAIPGGRKIVQAGDGYDVTLYAGDLQYLFVEDTKVIIHSSAYLVKGIGPGPVVFHFTGNPGSSPDDDIHACVTISGAANRIIRCMFWGGST